MMLRLAFRPVVQRLATAAAISPRCQWPRSLTSTPQPPSERLVCVSSARSLLDDQGKKVKFVDVRAPEAYRKAHIPGAANINGIFTYLATSDPEGVEDLKNTFEGLFQDAGINGDEHIVTYEDGLNTMYGASCRGYYLLKLFGHPKVSVLNGGFESWLKQGHQTRSIPSGPEPVPKGTFRVSWTPSMWSGKEDVVRAVEEKDVILLDIRDLEEWKAVSSSPYGVDFAPRKGRIPSAVHITWHHFMETKDDGLTYFREPADIRERCEAHNITSDQKIIVYCFKGARAANTYIALKEAGFTDVSNYFASWNEWSRDHSLSIESGSH